jgi:hypothetical protein
MSTVDKKIEKQINTMQKKRRVSNLKKDSETLSNASDLLSKRKKEQLMKKVNTFKIADMELGADVEGMYKEIVKAADKGNEKKFNSLIEKFDNKLSSARTIDKSFKIFNTKGSIKDKAGKRVVPSQVSKDIRKEAGGTNVLENIVERNKGSTAKKKRPRGVGIASRGYGKAMK